jgi:16S rRNA C1402 (ribose-2'-O) methylase RsmI
MVRRVTWFDDVCEALHRLGGKAHLTRIYEEVEAIRKAVGRSLTKTWENTVRQTLEDHCREASFRSGKDVFCMPEGRGAGVWAFHE